MRFFRCEPPTDLDQLLGVIGLSADEVQQALASFPSANRPPLIGVEDPDAGDLSGCCIYLQDIADIKKLGVRPFGLCLINNSAVSSQEAESFALTLGQLAGPVVAVADAKLAFIQIANWFYHERFIGAEMIHGDAEISADCVYHPSTIVGEGAKIGARCYLGPGVLIGPGVVIGDDTHIAGPCSIYHAEIGKNCHFAAGVQIGQAGFGIHGDAHGLVRVPQLGRVKIGERVCIGANTTIDRGTLRDTVIGDDCHIDNLVQIAHNVILGARCIIAAQTGLSGSCVIDDDVVMGGQVGFADHVSVGKGARLAAKSGIMHNVPAGQTWAGLPAKPIRQFMREVATLSRITQKKR